MKCFFSLDHSLLLIDNFRSQRQKKKNHKNKTKQTKPPSKHQKPVLSCFLSSCCWGAFDEPDHLVSVIAKMHWTLEFSFFPLDGKWSSLCKSLPYAWPSWVYVMGLLTFLWPPSGIIRCSSYQVTESRTTQEQRALGGLHGRMESTSEEPLPEWVQGAPAPGTDALRWLTHPPVPGQRLDRMPACPSRVQRHLMCRIQQTFLVCSVIDSIVIKKAHVTWAQPLKNSYSVVTISTTLYSGSLELCHLAQLKLCTHRPVVPHSLVLHPLETTTLLSASMSLTTQRPRRRGSRRLCPSVMGGLISFSITATQNAGSWEETPRVHFPGTPWFTMKWGWAPAVGMGVFLIDGFCGPDCETPKKKNTASGDCLFLPNSVS